MGSLLSRGALRIGYVGNFTKPWCTEVHVAASLEQLGHSVFRLQENSVNFDALPRLARSRRIALLLWTRTWSTPYDVGMRMLDGVRRAGVTTASFHLDRWHGLGREPQLESEPFFRTDLVVTADGTNDERWRELGINHRWLPPGVYGPECTPVEPDPERHPYEIVFVGSQPYPHAEWQPTRSAMINALHLRYGPRFAVYPAARVIRGRALAQLYATARVVVGDSCLVPPVRNYWSDRVPETLGRGGYLVHPHVDGIDEWYPELPTFDVGDHDALIKLVDAALWAPEATRLQAKRQRALVLGRDTYAHRMTTLLDWLREL